MDHQGISTDRSGERLRVRKMTAADAEPLYGLLSDPGVMKCLEPPYTREQTERFLIKAGLPEIPLICAAEKDERFIGYVIFHDSDEESIEIGWVLAPSCRGQGIASAFTARMPERIRQPGRHAVIECVPEQRSTVRIAERFGFRCSGVEEGLTVFRL